MIGLFVKDSAEATPKFGFVLCYDGNRLAPRNKNKDDQIII